MPAKHSGCQVTAAIRDGRIDAGRLDRYRKLVREDRHNTMTTAERRSRDKSFGKMVKSVMSEKKRLKGSDR